MKIAVDLSTLQTGHRMRGIGAVLINFINHLPQNVQNEYIFFLNPGNDDEILDLLKLESITYSIRYLKPTNLTDFRLPGKLNIITKVISKAIALLEFNTGDRRIGKDQLTDIDSFLQFDQSQKLPKFSKKHTTMILYDIIPYVMESDYLWSYSTARLNGRTRRSAIKCTFHRYQYLAKLKTNCRRAKRLIAISEHTKADVIKYVNVNESKISVCLLGADLVSSPSDFKPEDNIFTSFEFSSWGSIPQKVNLSKKPFILFIGGADPRRRLMELAAAYNNIAARGYNISLVLAGDTMLGPDKTPHVALQTYLRNNNSYIKDIHFLGFVSDRQKSWLYKNALVYVYPSVYEGFGLPIIEAMQQGTPVITYKNTSIEEVGKDAAIYTKDYLDITNAVIRLLEDSPMRLHYSEEGKLRSALFNWQETTKQILDLVTR